MVFMSYMLIMFAGILWILRIAATLAESFGKDFPISVLNMGIEIPLLFATFFFFLFIFKRKIIGALAYMIAYVGYFGTPPQNVASASTTLDYSDYGNVGVCNGEAPAEGDSFTQQIVYVGQTELTGNNRHEIYIDGSGVSHTYQVNDGQGGTTSATYTEEEYRAVLINYATAALLKHMNPLTIKLEARNTVPVYGTDYEMGDTMPIIIKEIGLRAKATVTAVKLIYEESGKSMELTFSNFKLLD